MEKRIKMTYGKPYKVSDCWQVNVVHERNGARYTSTLQDGTYEGVLDYAKRVCGLSNEKK